MLHLTFRVSLTVVVTVPTLRWRLSIFRGIARELRFSPDLHLRQPFQQLVSKKASSDTRPNTQHRVTHITVPTDLTYDCQSANDFLQHGK